MKLIIIVMIYLTSMINIYSNITLKYNNMSFIPGGIYIPLFKTNNIATPNYVKPFNIDKYPNSNIEIKKFI